MKKFVLATIAIAALVAGAAHAATFVKKDRATLRALDKITGRSTDIEVKVGEPVVFGSLKVELKVCYQTHFHHLHEQLSHISRWNFFLSF